MSDHVRPARVRSVPSLGSCHEPPGRSLPLLTPILLTLLTFALLSSAFGQGFQSVDIDIDSGGLTYTSYLAVPDMEGVHPAIVLLHSFNGMEEGYRTMVDAMAADGFVVVAPGWQTFERSPSDDVVLQLVLDSIDLLKARDDVDADRIGLTGFCAGGRYTMLFLPQINAIAAGVAWYGFPYAGDTQAASLIDDLKAPMLILHGTRDVASAIDDIYRYAAELDAAEKSFELKVYQGEPHGFMLDAGQMRTDAVASDAFREMLDFFRRKLG